jgi:hypothetical protein
MNPGAEKIEARFKVGRAGRGFDIIVCLGSRTVRTFD